MRGYKTKALSKEAAVSFVPSFVDLLQTLFFVDDHPDVQQFSDPAARLGPLRAGVPSRA